MPAPVVTVEMAPGYSANDFDPDVWRDISSYVRLQDGVNFNRGRQDEVSTVSAGSLQLTLNNDDGRFTPGYVSGVYDPLRIGCQIRVSVTTTAFYDLATDYDSYTTFDAGSASVQQWLGNITDFGAGFTNGYRPITRIQAVDRFALLSNKKLRVMYEEEVALSGPVAFYPLTDPTGSKQANESTDADQPSLQQRSIAAGGTIDFGVAVAVNQANVSAASFTYTAPTGTVTGYRELVGKNPLGSSTWSVEAWMAMVPQSLNPQIDAAVVALRTNGSTLASEYTGIIVSGGFAGAGTTLVNNGKWHHLATTYDGTTLRYYVDGIFDSSENPLWSTFPTWSDIQIGGYNSGYAAGGNQLRPFFGNIYGVALYNRALTAGEVTAHYRSTAFAGPSARLRRLSAFVTGFELDVNGVDGPYVAGQDTNGVAVLDAMQDAAGVGGAVLYIDHNGTLTADMRDTRYNQAPTLTLSPQAVGAETEWLTNNAYLVNDVSVTAASGRQVRSRSTTSQESVGAYTQQLSLPVYDDDDAYQLAAEIVAAYESKIVPPRMSTLNVDVVSKQATVSAAGILNRDIGDMVRLVDLPIGSPAPWTDVIIEGVSQRITHDSHTVTWALSPVLPTSNVVTLNDSTYGIVTEYAGSLTLTNDITASQTSISITSSSTITLSTSSADYPLVIKVGDELMRITSAPGSATSPQVVTVARNIDQSNSSAWLTGTRFWQAGTAVSLFVDSRVSLV